MSCIDRTLYTAARDRYDRATASISPARVKATVSNFCRPANSTKMTYPEFDQTVPGARNDLGLDRSRF